MTNDATATAQFIAETPLPGLAFSALRAVLLQQAEAHDMPLLEDSERCIRLGTSIGSYAFLHMGGETRVTVRADRDDWLFALKDGLTETLETIAPETAKIIRWSDAKPEGSLPPNFQFVSVVSVEPLGRAFLRMVVAGEDFSKFDDSAIHFRLVMPPKGETNPVWPSLSQAGTTDWPKGDKALHRPVYTARHLDHERNLLTLDIFVHEGGRVTDWAQTVSPGSRIGLIGPGGGGIPDLRPIHLFADETGFPAVARILETLPNSASGTVTLNATAGAACRYPFPKHPGITVKWQTGPKAVGLSHAAQEALDTDPNCQIWFASEKGDAQAMRAHLKAKGISAKDHYIAGYWTRS